MKFVRCVSFGGYDFDANSVVAVDPVASVSTGPLACDWDYGVQVRLMGGEITFLSLKSENYGWAGDKNTPHDRKRNADGLRQELLELIWPSVYAREEDLEIKEL